MTTVLCITHDGKTVMASDSAGSNDSRQWISDKPKIIQIGDLVFGYSGSYREAQIIEFEFSPLKKMEGESNDKYIYRTINELKELFEKHKTTNEETRCKGSLIIYYKKKIYLFETDYQVDDWMDPFEAIGSGSYYAVGAMTALLSSENKYTARQIAEIAIQTAIKHDPFTGGQVYIVELD